MTAASPSNHAGAKKEAERSSASAKIPNWHLSALPSAPPPAAEEGRALPGARARAAVVEADAAGGVGFRGPHGQTRSREALEVADQVGVGQVAVVMESLKLACPVAEDQALAGDGEGIGQFSTCRRVHVQVDADVLFGQDLLNVGAQR